MGFQITAQIFMDQMPSAIANRCNDLEGIIPPDLTANMKEEADGDLKPLSTLYKVYAKHASKFRKRSEENWFVELHWVIF